MRFSDFLMAFGGDLLFFVFLALYCVHINAFTTLNSGSLVGLRSKAVPFVLASRADVVFGQEPTTTPTSPSGRLPMSPKVLNGVNALKRPLAVGTGTLSAWLLQSNWKLASPLVAAVVVGLTSAPLSPLAAYQAPLYCGAFAGTTSIGIVKGPSTMVALAVICAAMFETFERKKLFPGKGGRLGMCATTSSSILTLLCGKTKLKKEGAALVGKILAWLSATASNPTVSLVGTGQLTVRTCTPAFAAASSGAVLSTFLRRRGWGPVPASALCGALGTLGMGGAAGGLFYMGSFIGMSANANDPEKAPYATQMLAANLAAFFFLAFGQYVLGGVGGKLGAAALCGVLACGSVVTYTAERKRLVKTIKKYRNVPNM